MNLTWRVLKDLKLTSDTTWARVEGSPRADRSDEVLAAGGVLVSTGALLFGRIVLRSVLPPTQMAPEADAPPRAR